MNNTKAILAGVCVALMGSAAQATVIYSLEEGGTFNTQQVGASTVNFNDGTCGAYAECNDADGMVTGSVSGQYASPYGITDGYLAVSHGSATLSVEGAHDYFGLYWGSIDSYNSLSFYLGESLVETFSGDDLAPLLANGDQGSWMSNRYVNFYFNDGDAFDRVVVTSTGYSFESDNHAVGRTALYTTQTVSVPEPGTLALLAAGLLGFGVRRRRAR